MTGLTVTLPDTCPGPRTVVVLRPPVRAWESKSTSRNSTSPCSLLNELSARSQPETRPRSARPDWFLPVQRQASGDRRQRELKGRGRIRQAGEEGTDERAAFATAGEGA